MGSKTEKMRKNEEKIKEAIVSAYRRGVCDSEGRSITNSKGLLIPKPHSFNSTAKTYVNRNGKLVEK